MNKILIIEDDKNISDLLSMHLRDSGFGTEHAFDGREGLLKALNENYKLIVLDIKLPGMDSADSIRSPAQTGPSGPVFLWSQ